MKIMFRLIAFILSITLLTAGCASETPVLPDSDDTSAVPTEDMELRVYFDSYTKTYMQGLLDVFAKEFPEVEIIVEDYSDMNIPDYRTKLVGDLMAGDGPDVLLVSNTANNTLYNLTKLLQNDVFLDIAETGADLSGCNEKVMKAGIYNGTQYLVPINYGLDFLLTTEERLDEYDIVYDKGLREFSDSIGSIYEAGNYVFMSFMTTETFWRVNGLSLIDYQANKLEASEKNVTTFEELAYSVNKLFPELFTVPGKGTEYYFPRLLKNYNSIAANAFISGDLAFYSDDSFLGSYGTISMFMSACDTILKADQTPKLIHMPSLEGCTSAPAVNYFLSVNANTKNAAAAGLFIESAVGLESQYTVSATAGIPVNNELVEIQREFYVDGEINENYSFKEWDTYPKQVVNYYFDHIDSMTDGVLIDYTAASKLDTIIKEYALNSENFDAALTSGKRTLEMYLNE